MFNLKIFLSSNYYYYRISQLYLSIFLRFYIIFLMYLVFSLEMFSSFSSITEWTKYTKVLHINVENWAELGIEFNVKFDKDYQLSFFLSLVMLFLSK